MYPNQPMYGMPGYGFRNPMYQQTQQLQQMTVTPVTGMAQVDSAQVSFDGAPLFFYDTSADAVYVKQFNAANGTAPVTIYRREQQAQPPQYVTMDAFSALAQRVEEMSAMIAPKRKPAKEAEAE